MKKIKAKRLLAKLGTDDSAKKIGLLIFIYFVFIGLTVRMAYIQIYQHNKYRFMSENNRLKERRIESERGKIYDRNGTLLVSNGTGFRLLYSKGRSYTKDDLDKIVELTELDRTLIERGIRNGELSTYTKESTIVENLDEKTAHKIMEKLNDDSLVSIEIYSQRKYIYDSFASHILGYVKKISNEEFEVLRKEGYTQRDFIGKSGIEKEYDNILKGKAGYEKIEVNAYNRVNEVLERKRADNGERLNLAISLELQAYMEKVLEEENFVGSVVTLNPKTGNIITMVSYPTFSLEMYNRPISTQEWSTIMNDKRRPLHNKAIGGVYPPGSIYKPISALSFLSKGVDPKTTYFDPGYYEIGTQRWRSWKAGGHGNVNMEKSLIESVNPYYYRFAHLYGHESLYDFANRFGLGKKAGIDIPGEVDGVNPNRDWKMRRTRGVWVPGDTVNMSIGQGFVLVTPLQMAQVYSVLANQGYAYKPKLLKSIGEDGKEVQPELAMKLDISKENFNLMTTALEKTVSQSNGTTQIMATPGVRVAAKSGSAQNSHSKETHAWIAGFFPVEDPEVVFVVLLEGAGGGGKIAGGVAKKFLDKYLELKEEGTFKVDVVQKPKK